MSKRKRFEDRHNAGVSRIAPYLPGESGSRRHGRRLETALALRATVEDWATRHGFTLSVTNDGHHWTFEGPTRAEWWPSSAKLVFNKQWKNGIHCHDVEQLATLITKRAEGRPGWM